MRRVLLIVCICCIALLFAFAGGCSNRGTNSSDVPELIEGGIVEKQGAHVFFEELILQIRNPTQQLEIAAYLPLVAFDPAFGGENRPVPMVILLPPQDGDEHFFFNHGLKELADEMISRGEIQPMAIVCISNNPVFGGYFFAGDGPGAGFYDSLMDSTMVNFLHNEFIPVTIRNAAKRGIGGVGMGAYGAFRSLLRNPELYSAIAVADGPLDFDGPNGTGGFVPLFDDALAEQGLLGGPIADFDSSSAWPLSRLFIGGALAFSPRDTAITWDAIYNADFELEAIVILTRDSLLPGGPTLVRNIVSPADRDFDFHLPFDANGTVYQPIWQRWMRNNLDSLLPAVNLAGTNIWIGTSPENTFANYSQQTESFISTLTGTPYNYPVQQYRYTGYDGHPAYRNQYVYDLMREMLIYFSDSFGD